jgi:hypothetical protein
MAGNGFSTYVERRSKINSMHYLYGIPVDSPAINEIKNNTEET